MYQYFKRLTNKPIELLKWITNQHGGRLFPDTEARNDLKIIPIDDNSHIEVFWKTLKYGKGPAISVYIKKEEILRVDCSGSITGHLHAAFFLPTKGEVRLLLSEKTCSQQIERAEFEICKNLVYYKSRVANAKVRNAKLNQEKIETAARIASNKMREFQNTIPELRDK